MLSFIVPIYLAPDLFVVDCRCDIRKTKVVGKTEKTTYIYTETLRMWYVWNVHIVFRVMCFNLRFMNSDFFMNHPVHYESVSNLEFFKYH